MAIKIPRGEQPAINLPKGSALSNVRDVVGPNLDRLTSFLQNTAEKKHANDIRLENLRVANKVSSKRSVLEGMSSEFIQKTLKEAKETPTPEAMETYLKQQKMKMEAEYNRWSQGDNNFKNAFEGEFYSVLNETRDNMYVEKNKRILLDARKSWDIFITSQKEKLTDLPPKATIWLQYGIMEDILKREVNQANAAGIDIQWSVEKDSLYKAFWTKAVIGDHYRTDEAGNKVVDNIAVLKSLKEKGKPQVIAGEQVGGKQEFWYGERLTDDMRKDLIKHYDGESDNQINFENKFVIRHNDNIVTNSIDGILSGDITISQIREFDFKRSEGEDKRESLITLRERVIKQQVPTETNLKEYNHIWDGLIDGTITSMFQPFKVAGEEDERSIIDRLRSSISDEDGKAFRQYLDQVWTNPEMVFNRQQFNEWKKDFEKIIIGTWTTQSKQVNTIGTNRWKATVKMLEKRYFEGITKGLAQENLLDPDHPDYIFKDLKRHIPSYEQEQTEMSEIDILKMGEIIKTETEDFGPPKDNPRKYPTDQEYFNSKEFKAWLNDEEKQKKWKEYLLNK